MTVEIILITANLALFLTNIINRYHNIFDEKVSKFVTPDLLKSQIEEEYNDKLMKLDKEDR